MSIFVLMANTSYHNYLIWVPVGYGFCIVLLVLMGMIDAPAIWKILIYVITGFVIVFLIEVTFQIIRKLIKKEGKNTSLVCFISRYLIYFCLQMFTVREGMFYEYTFQMLFKRPSKNWVSVLAYNFFNFK